MTSFAHLAVRAPSEQVGVALRELPGGAYVGPTVDRWCGVLLRSGTEHDAVAGALSDASGVAVLRVQADEAALDVALYVYGQAVAGYRSDAVAGPGGAQRARATAEQLIDATGASALPDDVAAVLTGAFAGSAERYRALVEALGLPPYLDGAGGGEPVPEGFVAVGGA